MDQFVPFFQFRRAPPPKNRSRARRSGRRARHRPAPNQVYDNYYSVLNHNTASEFILHFLKLHCLQNAIVTTRMHSSRMRTVRCNGHLSCHSPLATPTTHAPPRHTHTLAWHVPPMDRMTDACENITFPQLLLQKVNMP